MTNDHLGEGWGGLRGLRPPSQKLGGLGGSAPQPKFFEKTKIPVHEFIFRSYLFKSTINMQIVSSLLWLLPLSRGRFLEAACATFVTL